MDEPWFRKFAGFSYRPIRWQGTAVLAAMVGVCIPCGAVFLVYVDSHPLIGWGAAITGAAAAFAGHAVVVWKLERDYS
jgi:p-aminobenzoyl-glutamate transporter AbgT